MTWKLKKHTHIDFKISDLGKGDPNHNYCRNPDFDIMEGLECLKFRSKY